MELEPDTLQSTPAISDDVRAAALTKKTTLSPIHADVAPETTQGESVPTAMPLPNLPSDSESTYSSVNPVSEPITHSGTSAYRTWIIVGAIAAVCALAGLIAYMSLSR